jgi:hypothetical protein
MEYRKEYIVSANELDITIVSGLICLGAGILGFKWAFIGTAAAVVVGIVAGIERSFVNDITKPTIETK